MVHHKQNPTQQPEPPRDMGSDPDCAKYMLPSVQGKLLSRIETQCSHREM